MVKERIELMAPAGNFESMMAAIQGGADSVYFGIEQLNMRARATMNFTLEDLGEIARICNQHGVKSYITLNTILYDHDLSLMRRIVDEAASQGISAIIASDQAAIGYARSKGMPVHISTQVNISNIETIKFYALFADVMVLARELSMIQMREITQTIEREKITGPSGELVRIEVFAHGALCMAISGKCYLSLHTHNSSANRGVCIQNCRRQYEVKDRDEGHEFHIENEYIMSPKDLNTLPFL
ncbi:MAG TPA: peptidase U32 family protein, partial [Saprospiraceae bacterium]|nr:peptidase U32 family protein [Saprospiraceae bacterium]